MAEEEPLKGNGSKEVVIGRNVKEFVTIKTIGNKVKKYSLKWFKPTVYCFIVAFIITAVIILNADKIFSNNAESPYPVEFGVNNNITNVSDAYIILVLQWKPQICHNNDAPNCANTSIPNITIHGIWPNYLSISSKYPAYCSTENYLSREDIEPLIPKLNIAWPTLYNTSTNFGFWSYQWHKHGTCWYNPEICKELRYHEKKRHDGHGHGYNGYGEIMDGEGMKGYVEDNVYHRHKNKHRDIFTYFGTALLWRGIYNLEEAFERCDIVPSNKQKRNATELTDCLEMFYGQEIKLKCTSSGQSVKEFYVCFDYNSGCPVDCGDIVYSNCGDNVYLSN